jgi:thioredoxin 1
MESLPTSVVPELVAAQRVTGETFEERVLKDRGTVLVFYWAPWCAPCRTTAETLAALMPAYAGRVTLATVDTDQDEDLVRRQAVAGLPTIVIYRNGEAGERIVGVASAEALRAALDAALRPTA